MYVYTYIVHYMPALKSMHALIDSTAFGVNVIIIHALGLRIWMWSVGV